MKKILMLATFFAIQASSFAQTADSVSMLPGTVLDVYYNFSTGNRDTVRNNNWHIAFATRKAMPPLKTMQAVSIRINEGRNVEIFKSNTLISSWSTFDTAGWMAWPTFYNSDSSWDIGALNQERNMTNPYDYGWGQYNQTSHNVEGSNIWLIAITTSPVPGAPKTLKRLAVQKCVYDTQWVFILSNVDGTDSTTMIINKASYNGKMFAYVDVLSKTVIDREPMMNSWDLLFTRYKALVTLYGQTLMYPVMGILHNPIASTAKLIAPGAKTTAPSSSLVFKENNTQIGWDWKYITTSPGAWPVKDSLAYFVKLGVNNYWSLSFNAYFADASVQYIKFNKKQYTTLTGVEQNTKTLTAMHVYPNPATDGVNVNGAFNNHVNQLNLSIIDITGREVLSQNYSDINGAFSASLATHSLKSGLYFISISADGAMSSKKLIIE
ncbi:MAG: T9SS type A sorting domain-containing protein [Bacteroidota bacterium]|nr:T9SS type A sorting domain-containing protein [Bacteroidota bacterium]